MGRRTLSSLIPMGKNPASFRAWRIPSFRWPVPMLGYHSQLGVWVSLWFRGWGSSISGDMMNYQPKQCTIFRGNPPNSLYMVSSLIAAKWVPFSDPCISFWEGGVWDNREFTQLLPSKYAAIFRHQFGAPSSPSTRCKHTKSRPEMISLSCISPKT